MPRLITIKEQLQYPRLITNIQKIGIWQSFKNTHSLYKIKVTEGVKEKEEGCFLITKLPVKKPWAL